MEGSWLSQALPQYSPSSLSPENERRHQSKSPRWRTRSPMSASIIPPPVVSSVHLPTSPQPSNNDPSSESPTDHDLLLFRKQQRQLEAHLQLLLDAQADGLLAGLDPSPSNLGQEDGHSTGSSTPTAFNLNTRSKPPSRLGKPALRDARYGLYTTIRRLAQLKAAELDYLAPNIDHVNSVVSQLDAWQKKRHALQARTSQIHAGADQKRAYDLHRQADDMQKDINDLEAKLAKTKADQRRLRAQAQEIENTVDARLSSYASSLSLVDQDVQTFLHHNSSNHWNAVINTTDMAQFRQLPPETRTLDAAHNLFIRERDSLLEKHTLTNTERDALEEGAIVWKDTVKLVSAFERKLARAMSGLSNQSQTAENDKPSSNSPATTQELLVLLEETTVELENRHKHAETRNWKLLVCAIGAELEACLKGKQILEAALASMDQETDAAGIDGHASNSGCLEGVSTPKGGTRDESEVISNLDDAFSTKTKAKSVSDTDTEDDGPDPELLISHHDTDDTD